MSKKNIILTEGDTSTVLIKITMRAVEAPEKRPLSGETTAPVEKKKDTDSTLPRKAAGAEQPQSSRIIRVSMD